MRRNKEVENRVNILANCCTIVSNNVGMIYIERIFQFPVTCDNISIPHHTYNIEE